MTIALDAQGAKVVSPWVEKANATYRTLVDKQNVIGKAYSVKFVPLGVFVEEDGRLAKPVSFVDISDENLKRELTEWVTTSAIPKAWIDADQPITPRELTAEEAEADARFQLAIVLLERGKQQESDVEPWLDFFERQTNTQVTSKHEIPPCHADTPAYRADRTRTSKPIVLSRSEQRPGPTEE